VSSITWPRSAHATMRRFLTSANGWSGQHAPRLPPQAGRSGGGVLGGRTRSSASAFLRPVFDERLQLTQLHIAELVYRIMDVDEGRPQLIA
jgi:hypothetical protein